MNKLWILLAAALVLAVYQLIPFKATDVSKLQPVQTMVISTQDGTVCVSCDEDLTGYGSTLRQAMKDLENSAPGTVFLGTAEQIVVCGDSNLIRQLTEIKELRPAAQLYLADTVPDAEEVTAFLYSHDTDVTLLDLKAAVVYGQSLTVPCLAEEQGRYELAGTKQI